MPTLRIFAIVVKKMEDIAVIWLIFFIAVVVRSTFGFGDGLIAMPLLSLTLGVRIAAPLFALISCSVGLAIILTSWRKIDLMAVRKLLIASVLGIPLGVTLLRFAPEAVVIKVLGILLISFGCYRLSQKNLSALQHPNWAYLLGFTSGMLGGAYNTGGPPIVIYGTLNRWQPEKFRATLQGYFLLTGLLVVLGHGLTRLWTSEIFQLYGLTLPIVLAATFLGDRLNQRLSTKRFENAHPTSDRLLNGGHYENYSSRSQDLKMPTLPAIVS